MSISLDVLDKALQSDERYQYFEELRRSGLMNAPHEEIVKVLPHYFPVDDLNTSMLHKITTSEDFEGKWSYDVKPKDGTNKEFLFKIYFERPDSATFIRMIL